MKSQTLMIQGTTSDAGKSTFVAGLCRLLYRLGYSVAPFKPQNMALNSAVTIDKGEIGRAQAVQAHACGLKPHTDMNPVLIKPSSDTQAQIIIHGKAVSDMDASDYHRYKTIAMNAVLESYKRLTEQYDFILVEGAGSPAEINLRDRDIANMGFAEAVNCPVILIADIDKGGVFAHLTGTVNLLSKSEQDRIKGFVINKFRGDIALLEPGLDWLEEYSGKKVFGTLPFLHNFHLEAEDAINSENIVDTCKPLNVVIPVLPRISNHTDFDILRLHPEVNCLFLSADQDMPDCDLLILPGSKNVRDDLQYLIDHNWKNKIDRHLRYGGKLLGICGGFQMLGMTIDDPDGIESTPGSINALRYLDFATTLDNEKQLTNQSGHLLLNNADISGYEIHTGISKGPALDKPAVQFTDGSFDGVMSEDKQILGTYLHGLFDQQTSCTSLLRWAGLDKPGVYDYRQRQEDDLNRLADMIKQHCDIDAILQIPAVNARSKAEAREPLIKSG